jgi:ribosomal protein S18 acetylase RimI-like enzyme
VRDPRLDVHLLGHVPSSNGPARTGELHTLRPTPGGRRHDVLVERRGYGGAVQGTGTARSTARLAVPHDAAALAEVAAVTFPLACPPTTTKEASDAFVAAHLTEARFLTYLADPDRVLIVADPGGAAPLDGYTMLVLTESTDPDVLAAVRIRPTCELSKCYVRAGAHGRGVAAALLDRSLDEARARGAAGMWLGTNTANLRAIRFYEKHGFTKVGHKRFKLGGGYEEDFVMERPIG